MKKLLTILFIIPIIGYSQGYSGQYFKAIKYIDAPLFKINGTSIDTSTSTIRWFTAYKYALLNSKKANSDSVTNHGYATNYKLKQKVSSQWTTSSSNIYFNSGSVGIGYASPSYTLHVKGGIDADSIFIGGAKLYAGDPNRWTDFNHNIYTDWGFVGINTNIPKHWLEVAGGIKADSIFGKGLSFYDSTYNLNLKHNKAGALIIQGPSSEDYYMSFNTGSSRKTILIDEGEIGIKVGIGLGTPSYRLDVNGSINGTSYYLNGASLTPKLYYQKSIDTLDNLPYSNSFIKLVCQDTTNGKLYRTRSTRFQTVCIQVQALTSSPTDGQTVYFGMLPRAPITTANVSKVYIRKAAAIKVAEIYCYSGTAGTNENWSLYIRVNNTTDYLIQTKGVNTNERVFTNSSLNISLNAGDYFEIKSVQPTWATNPLTTIYGGYIYLELY